jgi:hypothetical protein
MTILGLRGCVFPRAIEGQEVNCGMRGVNELPTVGPPSHGVYKVLGTLVISRFNTHLVSQVRFHSPRKQHGFRGSRIASGYRTGYNPTF